MWHSAVAAIGRRFPPSPLDAAPAAASAAAAAASSTFTATAFEPAARMFQRQQRASPFLQHRLGRLQHKQPELQQLQQLQRQEQQQRWLASESVAALLRQLERGTSNQRHLASGGESAQGLVSASAGKIFQYCCCYCYAVLRLSICCWHSILMLDCGCCNAVPFFCRCA